MISVIIPTYNRCELLKKTIESVQNQTLKNLEILVCDDGSADDTECVVREMMKSDSRIKYLDCGHNGRPAIPRNIGINESKGEWISFLDDDDVWKPTKLEAQLFMMEKYEVKASATNALFLVNGVETLERYFSSDDFPTCVYKFEDFLPHNPVICSSMIVHRDVLDKCDGFPEGEKLKAIEDYALWLRVSCFSDVLFLSNPLVGYLKSNKTSIRKENEISFCEQRTLVMNTFWEWLAKCNCEEIVERYRRKYAQYLSEEKRKRITEKYFGRYLREMKSLKAKVIRLLKRIHI